MIRETNVFRYVLHGDDVVELVKRDDSLCDGCECFGIDNGCLAAECARYTVTVTIERRNP